MTPQDEEKIRLKRKELGELRVIWSRRQEAADNIMRRIVWLEEEISQLDQPPADVAKNSLRYGRVRSDIMTMLAKSMEGLDSVTIGRALKDQYGDAISARTHLTTLNRLKDGQLAVKVHGRWRLTADGHRERQSALED